MIRVIKVQILSLGLCACVLWPVYALAQGKCLTGDQVYQIAAGDLVRAVRWQGDAFTSTCDCGGVISGVSGDVQMCTVGSVCQCGTYNGRPWMGKVVLQPQDQVIDFGSTFKAFVRKRSFMRRFYELWLLDQRIGCVRLSNDADVATATCTVAAGVNIKLHGWDAIQEVDISWIGDLDPGLQGKFADLYVPDDKQPLLDSFALSTGIVGTRGRKFVAGWLHGSHWFNKPDESSPVEHNVSLSRF
jgi:hypothetical protein